MNCRFCNDKLVYQFVDLGFSPPSNSFLKKEDLIEKSQIKHSEASFTDNNRDNPFDKITAASIPNYLFSADWNAIGYDWKSHAFGAAGNYTVNSNITYIVKDTDGNYYKLRFLDFYNNKGDKGYPKFEFSRIK